MHYMKAYKGKEVEFHTFSSLEIGRMVSCKTHSLQSVKNNCY